MKLPGGQAAQIDDRKLTAYLLSAEHPVGKLKARFFAALGFETSNAPELRAALLRIAATGEVSSERRGPFGTKYAVDGYLEGSKGTAQIRTVWQLRGSDPKPRFLTAYPVGT